MGQATLGSPCPGLGRLSSHFSDSGGGIREPLAATLNSLGQTQALCCLGEPLCHRSRSSKNEKNKHMFLGFCWLAWKPGCRRTKALGDIIWNKNIFTDSVYKCKCQSSHSWLFTSELWTLAKGENNVHIFCSHISTDDQRRKNINLRMNCLKVTAYNHFLGLLVLLTYGRVQAMTTLGCPSHPLVQRPDWKPSTLWTWLLPCPCWRWSTKRGRHRLTLYWIPVLRRAANSWSWQVSFWLLQQN